jgi:hypothetical protein
VVLLLIISIVIEDDENDNEINLDANKQNIIMINILEIINKLLVENYNDSLQKLKENGFCLVKYLYFLKKEFDDKINNNEISKMVNKTYISKMKNIRYIVILNDNQHPL